MFGIRVHSPGQIYQNNNLSNNGPRDVTPILQTVPIDGLVGLIISISVYCRLILKTYHTRALILVFVCSSLLVQSLRCLAAVY